MKILYGIQGTGNGHLSRSKEIIRELKSLGAKVDVLITARDVKSLWDSQILEPFNILKGLTFITDNGEISYFKTICQLDFIRFINDVCGLYVKDKDLIISDFEPVSAWAAIKSKKYSIGIGHQYSFKYNVPFAKKNFLNSAILKYFAPVNTSIGLHWHHFNSPILPPVIPRLKINKGSEIENKILVYLPFENQDGIKNVFYKIKDFEFYIYSKNTNSYDYENLHLRAFSRENFLSDLIECKGVICNAGFELPSEAIHLGKKILVKAIKGQVEQHSNAYALTELNLGDCTDKITYEKVTSWLLSEHNFVQMNYPFVAEKLAEWILKGDFKSIDSLIKPLWENTPFSIK